MDEIDTYFTRMLNKEAYDKSGLIYGIGHAVYTISDPRAILLKELARDLAKEKGKEEEFAFLELLEERAIAMFGKIKNNGKTVSSNIDFYSGFVYEMIGLPQEIFTPLFAMARIVAVSYTHLGRSLHIRHPREKLSIAENFLYMLKKDYTELDARTLDLLLVLQAEHGGGNNSTFTVRVVSSSRTDTYSAIAAGIGSLKGPLHGLSLIHISRGNG